VGVKGQDLLFDFKMIQKFVGHAGVFGKNERGFLQDAQGPKCDIF